MSTQATFGQRLQREAGVAFGVAVGVAGEGAEFLAAPAQGVGGFGVLPRVAAVVVVEGEQACMGEVVGRLWAGGQSLCLPLQVLQPLRVAPFRERTLRCVGHRRFPSQTKFYARGGNSCWLRGKLGLKSHSAGCARAL
jgi:hypothetical protein